MFLKILEG